LRPTQLFPASVAAFLTLFDHSPAYGMARERRQLSGLDQGGPVGAKDDDSMRGAWEFVSRQKPWRGLLALGVMSVLIGGLAHAQNLDQGKSASRLFVDGCSACHRSARGLAKGRFSFTLYFFLQKHYASNSGSAWALASYLESVDSPQRGKSRAAAAKPSPAAGRTSWSPIRPPLPVP
jgi:mono/diheme cytochrome c family protein